MGSDGSEIDLDGDDAYSDEGEMGVGTIPGGRMPGKPRQQEIAPDSEDDF